VLSKKFCLLDQLCQDWIIYESVIKGCICQVKSTNTTGVVSGVAGLFKFGMIKYISHLPSNIILLFTGATI
jgi:hypothetical protein